MNAKSIVRFLSIAAIAAFLLAACAPKAPAPTVVPPTATPTAIPDPYTTPVLGPEGMATAHAVETALAIQPECTTQSVASDGQTYTIRAVSPNCQVVASPVHIKNGYQEAKIMWGAEEFCANNPTVGMINIDGSNGVPCSLFARDPRFTGYNGGYILHLPDGDYIQAEAPVAGQRYVWANPYASGGLQMEYPTGMLSWSLNGDELVYEGATDVGFLTTYEGMSFQSFLMRPYVPLSEFGPNDCPFDKLPEIGKTYLWRATPSDPDGRIPYYAVVTNSWPETQLGYMPSGFLATVEDFFDGAITLKLPNGNTIMVINSEAACRP